MFSWMKLFLLAFTIKEGRQGVVINQATLQEHSHSGSRWGEVQNIRQTLYIHTYTHIHIYIYSTFENEKEEHRVRQHAGWQKDICVQRGWTELLSGRRDACILTQRLRCWLPTSDWLPSPPKPFAGRASYWLPLPAPLHPLASEHRDKKHKT